MIKPLNDNVIVIPDKKETMVNGIYVPESAKKKPETGIVWKSDVEGIKKGDAILFKSYSATTVTIDKDDFLLVPKEDVLAIIEV
jgi:chaperonin GroES